MEELGAAGGTEGVEAIPESAIELIRPQLTIYGWTLHRPSDH